MARPLKPLQRLLLLRERIEQGEQAALRRVELALRREEEAFHSFDGVAPEGVRTAADWHTWQLARESAWACAQRLEGEVATQMEHWKQAKREHRQAERMVERRRDEREREQAHKESRQQEDWVRARDAREGEKVDA